MEKALPLMSTLYNAPRSHKQKCFLSNTHAPLEVSERNLGLASYRTVFGRQTGADWDRTINLLLNLLNYSQSEHQNKTFAADLLMQAELDAVIC